MAKRTWPTDEHGTQFRRMAPGQQMALINPSNTVDNCPNSATLYIVTGGTLMFLPEGNEDDAPITLTVADGTWLDQVTVRRVFATGTSATGIHAVF